MHDLTVPVPPSEPVAPVAPAWHTALLLALFLALALAGARFQGHARAVGGEVAAARSSAIPLYLSLIAAQAGLVAYVVRAGLRRTGTPLGALIGGRWASPRDVGVDVLLGAGLWATWQLVGRLGDRVLGTGSAASIDSFLPRGALESVLWVLVSASAGFAEEVVFRGYLQRQFTAWLGRPWIALALQAAVFGIAHGYQGARACARIALYGVLFGLLARWRRSLRPGMIGHAMHDMLAGLARL